MTENELISKIRKLRQISPSKEWVVLTKTQILGEQREQFSLVEGLRLFFRFKLAKPAFASLITVFILFGLFSFVQNSLPGDILYSIKKITERSQAVFVSETDKPQAGLELANKRLEELTKIAETNQVKKLAQAINEFQASVSELAKNLSKMDATSSDPVAIKKIVDGTKELGGKIQEVESLGVVIGEEEFDELQGVLVKFLISDLEKRTLWTEEQKELLNEMKELVEQGKYSEALELYLTKFKKSVNSEPTEELIKEPVEEPAEEPAEESVEEPTVE